MRGRRPRPLALGAGDAAILELIARSRSRPWFQVQHARILLGVAAGQRVQALAAQMQCDPATIWRVCRGYERHGLDVVLWEAARPGRPRQLSPPAARSNRAVGLPGTDRQGAAHHALDQCRLGPSSGQRRHCRCDQPALGLADLLRSGKATFLLGREDDFFALFPQPSFKLPPGTMVFQTSAPQDHQFAAVSPVTLSALTIAGTPPLNGFDEVRGKVAFANEGRVHGDLALRLTVLTQITQTLYYRLDMADLPAKGTLDFEFPPIVDKGMQTPGFALVLLDLCILHPADQQTKAMVVSNGLAIMLNLTAERHQ